MKNNFVINNQTRPTCKRKLSTFLINSFRNFPSKDKKFCFCPISSHVRQLPECKFIKFNYLDTGFSFISKPLGLQKTNIFLLFF